MRSTSRFHVKINPHGSGRLRHLWRDQQLLRSNGMTDGQFDESCSRNAQSALGACALCGRQCPLTFHHLIPRKLHRRTHFQKHFDKQQLQSGIYICRSCHRGIHKLFDEMTLGKRLNTLAALRAEESVQRHVAWVAKQRGC